MTNPRNPDDPRFLTEIDGVPVPLNVAGLPDPATSLGLAASLLPQCDASDADARGWQDARNATGHLTLSTSTLRRLIAAAVAGEVAAARSAASGLAPSVRYHVTETEDGVTDLTDRTGYSNPVNAVNEAREYNADEEGDEAPTVFRVVKATTTYEPFPLDSLDD